MLHHLVPTPETPEIVRLLGYEMDVADEGVADVEKSASLDGLLPGGTAVFVKLEMGGEGRVTLSFERLGTGNDNQNL